MKNNKRLTIHVLILLVLLVTACTQQRAASPKTTTLEEFAGVVTSVPGAVTETQSNPPQCAWNWATQPLPDVSGQLQTAFDKSGLTGITVSAEAYGENCYDSLTNQVAYFATMETDFRLVVQVDSLADRPHLGDMLERILTVIDDFPPGVVPGPQPGYVGVTFQGGEETLRLWFTVKDGQAARAGGLHGIELLKKLMEK
jgi:hypothetical protein